MLPPPSRSIARSRAVSEIFAQRALQCSAVDAATACSAESPATASFLRSSSFPVRVKLPNRALVGHALGPEFFSTFASKWDCFPRLFPRWRLKSTSAMRFGAQAFEFLGSGQPALLSGRAGGQGGTGFRRRYPGRRRTMKPDC